MILQCIFYFIIYFFRNLDLDSIKNSNKEKESLLKNKKTENNKDEKKKLENIDNNIKYYETKKGNFHKVESSSFKYSINNNNNSNESSSNIDYENFNINKTKNKLIQLENLIKSKNKNKIKIPYQKKNFRSLSSERNKKNTKIKKLNDLNPKTNKNLLFKENDILISYNILNQINFEYIIYDGEIYKIQKNKNNSFKLFSKYFQITKNTFRYYNNVYSPQVYNDKPILQFDIRAILNIKIINNKFLDLKEEYLNYLVFIIFLNNNERLLFATSNKKSGENIINILKLLKKYLKDQE